MSGITYPLDMPFDEDTLRFFNGRTKNFYRRDDDTRLRL